MKSLINYIKESSNSGLNNLWKAIKDLHPKLNPMENRSYDIADKQAEKWCEAFNEANTEYTAMTLREWLKDNGMTYSTKNDLQYGDIVLTNGKSEIHIDIKVSQPSNGKRMVYGPPTARSLVNFGNDVNNYYVCYSYNFNFVKIVNANQLLDNMLQGNDKFLPTLTNERRDIVKEFTCGTIKSDKVSNDDFENVYADDYVPSSILDKLSLI